MSTGTVCLIPARGGSKRLPRKNVKPLAGTPLIGWTVRAALDSGLFRSVLVSSDDEEILTVAERYGATPSPRPVEYGGDKVKAVEVLDEFLRRTNAVKTYEHIAMMLPTCPFRTTDDLRGAWEVYNRHVGERYLVTVTEYDFPPQLAMNYRDGTDELGMCDPTAYGRTTRSQDIGVAHHPNGALYLAPVEAFLRTKTFFADPLLGYTMPLERSFDIDTPFQFEVAERMMTLLLDKDLSHEEVTP